MARPRPRPCNRAAALTDVVGSCGVTDKDLVQLLKEAFDYAIHLEKNYPGADKASLPPASDYAWAQVTMTRHDTHDTQVR